MLLPRMDKLSKLTGFLPVTKRMERWVPCQDRSKCYVFELMAKFRVRVLKTTFEGHFDGLEVCVHAHIDASDGAMDDSAILKLYSDRFAEGNKNECQPKYSKIN